MVDRGDIESMTFVETTDIDIDIDMDVEVLTEAEYRAIAESYPHAVGGTRTG